MRVCRRCGVEYPKGGYSTHRLTHTTKHLINRPFTRPPTPRDYDIVGRIEGGQTLKQVGEFHGITRERVRQIYTRLTGHGVDRPLPFAHKTNKCAYCGKTYLDEMKTYPDRRVRRSGFRQHALAEHPFYRQNLVHPKEYPSRDAKIRELFERGLLYREIADRLGMKRSTTAAKVRRMGLRRYELGARSKRYPQIRAAIIHDWLGGMTEKELIEKYPGHSPRHVMLTYRGGERD